MTAVRTSLTHPIRIAGLPQGIDRPPQLRPGAIETTHQEYHLRQVRAVNATNAEEAPV